MEEKILIESQKSEDVKGILITLIIITTLLFLGLFFKEIGRIGDWYIDGLIFGSPALALLIFFVIIYCYTVNCKLIVTDKRVYGKASFGKRVDLPIDSISAVGTSFLWGVDVGTSSGRLHFKLIKNKDEIHSVLSKLLMERQQKSSVTSTAQNITAASNADAIKKYKELLDSGIITQEEFDEKKKQLLKL